MTNLKRVLLLGSTLALVSSLVPMRVEAGVEYCYKIHPVTGLCEQSALTGCSPGCWT
jgi:hypothetical protein